MSRQRNYEAVDVHGTKELIVLVPPDVLCVPHLAILDITIWKRP